MKLSKTPLRISLFGGGTDYPEYIDHNQSLVVGGTINKFVYTSATRLSMISNENYRFSYRTVEYVDDISEIEHPIFREVLRSHRLDKKYAFSTVSDIPGSSGLGSSSAFCVGLINLIRSLGMPKLHDRNCAEEAIFIEQTVLEENVGIQDQNHAFYGGFCSYLFRQSGFVERNILISQQSELDDFSRYFLLVFTGDYRKASDILKEQVQRNQKGDNYLFLDDMLDLALQAKALFQKGSILSSYSDRAQLGKMLQESWNLKRRLSSKISGSNIEEIIDRGLNLRAHGAKLLGAGGSGFVLFHAEHSVIENLKFEFGFDRCVEFCFTNEKSKVIGI